MPLVINTNTQSIFAQRALSKNTMELQKSTEKLSTGFRINRAADDAAGLSISEKLTAQINGLGKAEQNIGDGISLVQTAEGALSVIQDNLQRIRELSVQANNGTNGADEIDALQREVNARITTISEIAAQTSFNGTNLLAGTGDVTLQTGSDAGQTTTLAFSASTTGVGIKIDVTTGTDDGGLTEGVTNQLDSFQFTGATVASVDGTTSNAFTLTDIDNMIGNVSRMRSYLGGAQNSLESKLEFLGVAKENALSSRSRIKDVDVAKESSELLKSQILQQTASGMLSQANQSPQLALQLLP